MASQNGDRSIKYHQVVRCSLRLVNLRNESSAAVLSPARACVLAHTMGLFEARHACDSAFIIVCAAARSPFFWSSEARAEITKPFSPTLMTGRSEERRVGK